METQSDQRIRVVALSNLRAMCDRVSGTCHTYKVVKVSRSRVHVSYSNPDEYAVNHPVVAVFPCYGVLNHQQDPADNPSVVLDMLRVLNDYDGEGWQCFQVLMDCPTLWRGPGDGVWRTHFETERDLAGSAQRNTRPANDTCVVCDLKDHDTREGCRNKVCFCHVDPQPKGTECNACGCRTLVNEASL